MARDESGHSKLYNEIEARLNEMEVTARQALWILQKLRNVDINNNVVGSEDELLSGVVSEQSLHTSHVSDLRFIGSVKKDGVKTAIVSLPDGRIYALKINDVIGDQAYRVKKIADDSITLQHGTKQLNIYHQSVKNISVR